MKPKFLLFLSVFCSFIAQAQTSKNNETVALMNEVLSLYAVDEISHCTLYELTGILEQKQHNTAMRMSLQEIEEINVTPSAIGFIVNCRCAAQMTCFNLVKSDMSSNPVAEHVFLVRDLTAANTLGFCLSKLSQYYQKDSIKVRFTAAKDASGRSPVIMNQTAETKSPPAPAKREAKPIEEETDTEDPVNKQQTTSKTKQKRREATQEERKTSRNDNSDEQETEDENEKPANGRKRKPVENNEEPLDQEDEKMKNTPTKPQRGDGQTVKTDANCSRWQEIIQSGQRSGFKDIEGKELNAETQINESKIKLRNTKRNYLSIYTNQRAFIAEIKSHPDFGLLSEMFDALQEELDECLGGRWDTHDRSTDEEYSNYKGEIRDVEYRHESDLTLPVVRLIILEDGGKYTFFVRICKA